MGLNRSSMKSHANIRNLMDSAVPAKQVQHQYSRNHPFLGDKQITKLYRVGWVGQKNLTIASWLTTAKHNMTKNPPSLPL